MPFTNHSNPMLTHEGKICKASLIRKVADELGEPRDTQKILAVCRERTLTSFTAEQRKGVVFHDWNVSQALNPRNTERQRERRMERKAKSNGHAPKPPVPRIAPPPPENFTANELMAARTYLVHCGDSLLRATNLLKLVSHLTSTKG